MEIKCPNCASRFNLADEAVRPNAKLRCSVCQNVFPLAVPPKSTEAQEQDFDGENFDAAGLDLDNPSDTEKSKGKIGKKAKILLSIILLIVLGGGGGGYWYYTNYMVQSSVEDPSLLAKSVELMTMRNVRQYYVENEKIGSVFVIEGVVVNEFPVPKDLIEVEAAIYAKDKTPIMLKKQLAGTVLSLFQLQVLGEDELEAFLSNQIEILTRNTNVPPQGEVPFMVLFYNPPADVAEFGVKIISAKDVEAE